MDTNTEYRNGTDLTSIQNTERVQNGRRHKIPKECRLDTSTIYQKVHIRFKDKMYGKGTDWTQTQDIERVNILHKYKI